MELWRQRGGGVPCRGRGWYGFDWKTVDARSGFPSELLGLPVLAATVFFAALASVEFAENANGVGRDHGPVMQVQTANESPGEATL